MRENAYRSGDRNTDKLMWLAGRLFRSFQRDVSGIRFYTLTCGCIYYQRIFEDSDMDYYLGVYRDTEEELCEICMHPEQDWKDRAFDERVIYRNLS